MKVFSTVLSEMDCSYGSAASSAGTEEKAGAVGAER